MKKKILIFSDCFIFGGCEIVLTNLVNSELITKNFNIIYSYRKLKEYDTAVNSKVHCNDILMPIKLLSNVTFIYKLNLKKKWYNNLVKNLLQLISLLGVYEFVNLIILFFFFKKQNPDVLFINNGGYPGSKLSRIAVFAARLNNINKVLFNVNNMAYRPKYFFEPYIDKLICRYVYKFITASKAAKKRLSNARDFPLEKIITFPNCVKEIVFKSKKTILKNEFNLNNDTIVLGSVGLLSKRKGFSVLLDSLKTIINDHENLNIKLFIIGEGEERKNLENKIKFNGLKNYVNLVGYKSNVLDYVNEFDIFILPSISNEDMPYVILEAMMLKKPIIASKVAGTPEVVLNGKTGIIVRPGSANELATAISSLLNDKSLRDKYGKMGYERFKNHFKFEVIMKKYHDLFHSL